MSVPDPDHLLDQAERLIASTGGGAARQVDLRRAISSAYYALFHAVMAEAADDFIGRTHRLTARYMLVYRSVDHARLRQLCQSIANKPDRYSRFAPEGGFGSDMQFFASILVKLQNMRHLADYDPLFRATRSNAIQIVKDSHDALQRFRHASRGQRQAFLALVVFPSRQFHHDLDA